MAQLFLSYAREDRECAELLARALSNRGFSVWWDRRIQVGRSFSEVIEHELDEAHCVIVLWSRHSVASDWVQSEAAEAARRKVLVPVRIEDVRAPLEFRRLHTGDLVEWRKGLDGPEFDDCIASIELLVQKTSADPSPAPQKPAGTDIWISQDGKQFHAPDLATLRLWAEQGRVRADTHVYDPARREWIRAREVADLRNVWQEEKKKIAEAPVAAVEPQPARETPTVIWINQDGKQFSVPDMATLRLAAEEGRVKADSDVYDPAVGEWVRARAVPGLKSAFPDPPSTSGTGHHRSFVVFSAAAVGILLLLILIGVASKPSETAAADTAVTTTFSLDTVMTDVTSATDTTETVVTDATVATTDTAARTRPISVSVKNGCASKTLFVSLCFVDATNTWVSHGWYKVLPNQTRTGLAQAHLANVYFYAESGESRWQGTEGDAMTSMVPVHPTNTFGGTFEELEKTDGMTKVPFFGRTVEAGQLEYTQLFTCD